MIYPWLISTLYGSTNTLLVYLQYMFNIKRKQVPTFQMNTTRIWKCIKLKDNMFTRGNMCTKGGTCADKWMLCPLKNVKAFQHETGSAVDHDVNHFKNYRYYRNIGQIWVSETCWGTMPRFIIIKDIMLHFALLLSKNNFKWL